MDLKILKYYVFTCELIGITPSFEGLVKFKRYYMWECNKYGRG
jgi:hypothetical protein